MKSCHIRTLLGNNEKLSYQGDGRKTKKAVISGRLEGNNKKLSYQEDGMVTLKALISGRWEGNNESCHIRPMGG